ncbi:MAG: hypothetical protein ACLT3F_07545 [Gemmiger formicilis]|uniref:hypothetical protein n=1 Tax=Gemmiger formicilis TaxID=745368 RepID=UPI0039922F47
MSSRPRRAVHKVSRAHAISRWRIKPSPLWFSTTNLNANVRKWAHIYIYCALGVQHGRDRAAVAAPRYAAAKGTAGIGAVYAVRGR